MCTEAHCDLEGVHAKVQIHVVIHPEPVCGEGGLEIQINKIK